MNDPSSPVALPPGPGRAAARLQEAVAPSGPLKPKVKKLRLFLVIAGLAFIALISTVFGMIMAVSSDLPSLENRAEYRAARNSLLRADDGSQVARLTGNNNRILVQQKDISPNVKNAIIAIEDKRFYEHRGVDFRGIARALGQDVLKRRAAQGASTITQQFVKNATEAQDERTVLNKVREASLAYHLEQQWSKQKILTQYMNTVYFGNGAYGIESAVRTYFPNGGRTEGKTVAAPGQVAVNQPKDEGYDPKERGAANVTPDQGALLAGLIASPSAYDPVQHPAASKKRRDLVLSNMLEQDAISRAQYNEAIRQNLPGRDELRPPQPVSREPYFSTWVTQQLVDRYGANRVFAGGLDIRTTLDPELQAAAEQAIGSNLSGIGPSSSLVAIENKTGEVKALVGGNSFKSKPFNLATNGHRQPGSAFKPFILIEALRQGIGPGATFTSKKKVFPVPGSREKFVVNNYESNYSGVSTLENATVQSDNSVYAELGLKVGTRKVARLARRMGIETKVSSNPAMTLGGLKVGVTPLEMAYAYSTIANKGLRVSGTLGSRGSGKGPVAIEEVRRGRGGKVLDENDRNDNSVKRVFPEGVGTTAQDVMAGVIKSGTGKNAAIDEFAAGKTGTTENYGDAWFVGFNAEYTVAVWVGYADKLKPMKTEYRGSEVAGGTFPTDIWHDFMVEALKLRDAREAKKKAKDGKDGKEGETGTGTVTTPVAPVAPAPVGPGGEAGSGGGEKEPAAPEQD
nr:transglycosylase domain-containing protein [Thermoleophilaceae bacterium]